MRAASLAYFGIEVAPGGVLLLDHAQLPSPVPFLHALLSLDRVFRAIVDLVVDEAFHVVSAGEAGDGALAVLVDAGDQVACHADIEGAVRTAGQDVDVEALFHEIPVFAGMTVGTGWLLRG